MSFLQTDNADIFTRFISVGNFEMIHSSLDTEVCFQIFGRQVLKTLDYSFLSNIAQQFFSHLYLTCQSVFHRYLLIKKNYNCRKDENYAKIRYDVISVSTH